MASSCHEARFYTAEAEGLRCRLCPHACLIREGKRGICKVRENRAGVLCALTWGRAVAVHHDPIEKKPLFHVLPGSTSTSVAAAGCNLRCRHCQNHDISQHPVRFGEVPGRPMPPGQVVTEARRVGAASLSFTYTEPTIFFEWACDMAEAAAAVGIRSLAVTNGFISPEPLAALAPLLMAANVDLKAFDEGFYRDVCGGALAPVLDAIAQLKSAGVWVEVTTLLIPDLNDSDRELDGLARFLVSVDPDLPWHLSRFHPDNQLLDRPPTPLDTIHRARQIGRAAGLRHVYTGNVWGDAGENTLCPACGQLVIARHGFSVQENRLVDGRCPACAGSVAGVWS